MPPNDSARIVELLRAATRLPPSERAAFLARECAGNEALRAAVERLLTQQESATISPGRGGVAAEAAAPGAGPSDAPAARRPERIGSYTIRDILGEGGMGVVYLARQHNPERDIALKVLRPGILSPKLLRRFEHESQILGRLQHPGIAQIYEAGTAEVGGKGSGAQPFFAMELVRGPTLTAFAVAHGLSTRQRLALFIKVCEAVHHAHQKGVIHRDLKPGNILVADQNGDATGGGGRLDAQPKVLDFGIARATDADMQTATLQTDVGQLLGTVPYMSPEQVAGDPNDVDVRSDVYTLGVILYELLTSRLPHAISDKTIPEAVRIIGQEEPTPLSATDRTLRGDIQTIVAKSLEKGRARRYQSAEQLAADITRYLRDEPIIARPPTTVYQLSKFARRHKGLVAGAGAAVLILVAGATATAWQAVRATQGQNAAEEAGKIARDEADNAKSVNDFLTTMLTAADPEHTAEKDATVREMLDKAAESFRASPPASVRVRLSLLSAFSNTYRAVGQGEKAALHAKAAADLARSQYGPDHRDTLDAQRILAMAYNDLARYEESEAILRHAYDVILARDGEGSVDAAQITGELGSTVMQRGNFKEAEPLLRKAIRLATDALGPKHHDVMSDLDHLGSVLGSLGRFAESEEVLRKVLDIRTEVYGPEHPMTAFSLNNRANALQRLGRGPEAIELLEKALEIRRRRLEPDHPSMIITLQNLAVAMVGEKRYEEAAPVLREAVALQTKKYGEAHPKTLLMTGNLAYVTEDMGDPATAEKMFARIIEVRRASGLITDPEAWPQMNNLAMLMQKRGALNEAEAMWRECMALSRAALPEDHYTISLMRNNRGDCLVDMKRYEEAERELTASLAAIEKFFGPTHARALKAVGRLARLYEAWGKPEKAEPYKKRLAGS